MTGDNVWITHDSPKAKQQSQQWMHINSPNKPKKFKQTFNNKKFKQTFNNRIVMATMAWDQNGVLLVEFMEPGTSINAIVYC